MNELYLGSRIHAKCATYDMETTWERMLERMFQNEAFGEARRVEQELRETGRSSFMIFELTLVST
jgi:hypothetical protein